jgi:hypothetical protein
VNFMMPVQILFTAFFLGMVTMTWRRAFASTVSYVAAGLWTLFWGAAALVVWRPEVTNVFSNALGIGRGADLVMYVSVIALFYAAFRQTIRAERMDRQLTLLVRKMAIDEFRSERVKNVGVKSEKVEEGKNEKVKEYVGA